MDTIRTFVAVELEPAVIQRAGDLVERLQTSQADVKWVEPHNRHLTLKFLGEIPAAETAAVCRAVGEVAKRFPPIVIGCRGAGAFPDAHRPKTVWLGVELGRDQLAALQTALEEALAELGYPPEARRFHPHLTLGRVRSGGPALRELGRLIREQADFDAGRCTVQETVVFASHLDRAGPTYEALGRARLGTGDSA